MTIPTPAPVVPSEPVAPATAPVTAPPAVTANPTAPVVPATPVAPAPAPAVPTPPVEAPKPEAPAPTATPKELGYSEYTDSNLSQAVNILAEKGIKVEDSNTIFGEAVASGDISKIDYAALTEKLGEEKAMTVRALVQNYSLTTMAEYKAQAAEMHTMVGGEERFNAMTEWAKAKAAVDPEFAKELPELRAMLDSGQKRSMKAAVTELFSMYQNDPNTTIPAELLKGDSASGASSVEPLSRRAYGDALRLAKRKGTINQELPSLQARRKAGVKQNL